MGGWLCEQVRWIFRPWKVPLEAHGERLGMSVHSRCWCCEHNSSADLSFCSRLWMGEEIALTSVYSGAKRKWDGSWGCDGSNRGVGGPGLGETSYWSGDGVSSLRLLDLIPYLVAHKGDHRPAAYISLPKNMIDRYNPRPSLERGAAEIHLSKIRGICMHVRIEKHWLNGFILMCL